MSGIAPGVYTLDVIANIPNSDDRAAYETILVVLKPGQSPVQPVEVINEVKVITEVTFEEVEDDDECSNNPGSAGLPFPQDKRTECELEKWNDCKDLRERVGGTNWGKECDDIDEVFMDDDCFGFNNAEECNEYWNDRDAFCDENPNHKKCASSVPVPPICDENTPAGQLCRDEIDDCTDESGCTPDGRINCKHGTECPELQPPIEADTGDSETGELDIEGNFGEESAEEIPEVPEETEEEEVEEVEEESTEESTEDVEENE